MTREVSARAERFPARRFAPAIGSPDAPMQESIHAARRLPALHDGPGRLLPGADTLATTLLPTRRVARRQHRHLHSQVQGQDLPDRQEPILCVWPEWEREALSEHIRAVLHGQEANDFLVCAQCEQTPLHCKCER
jgi:hypothetical protein